jgi:hypothetical protein
MSLSQDILDELKAMQAAIAASVSRMGSLAARVPPLETQLAALNQRVTDQAAEIERLKKAGTPQPTEPPQTPALAAPLITAVTAKGVDRFEVDWDEVAGALWYQVEARDSANARPPIRIYGQSNSSHLFVEPEPRPQWRFWVRVRAENDAGFGPWSNEVEVQLPALPGAPPVTTTPPAAGDIVGQTFDGLRLEGVKGTRVYRGCAFRTPPGGWSQGHAVWLVWCEDVRFIDCVFDGMKHRGNAAIGGYGSVYVDGCVFRDCWQGIHLDSRPGTQVRRIVKSTRFEKGYRYPIELQNGGTEILIEDVEVGDYAHVYRDSGVSIASNETLKVVVRRLKHYAAPAAKSDPSKPESYEPLRDPSYDGIGARFGVGLEVGGREVLVEDCEFIGPFIKCISVLSAHGDSVKTRAVLRRNKMRGWMPNQWGTPDPVVRDGGSVIVNDWRRDNDWQ